ncbi:periplasmic trehalase [Neptunitalea chrysea]|uniref:Periplasmic trehalase n=2 Tax=Neptunitalea chrysea TaxID=1647581 RepID=A0A9W6EVT1_9FLAO|nr:periplasmic trehalase [Neptunitalea chrysea]
MITSFSLSCTQEVKKDAVQGFYQSEFFKRVQMESVFDDSKTFVDMKPNVSKQKILEIYENEKLHPDFNLKKFVDKYFTTTKSIKSNFITDSTKNMYQHISSMWPVLTRNADKFHPYGSRIPLPYPYVVPGGRFREIYYWDSYFTMQGLLVDGKRELAQHMVDNFSFLIDSLGFIPNGNRNYYLSRSQPPFYTLMVTALAKGDSAIVNRYSSYILKEYNYWMKGEDKIEGIYKPINAVFKTNDGTFLNRYWDYKNSPREESFKEDSLLAKNNPLENSEKLYKNLRSAAASGWDFSSRWYKKDKVFASTSTIEIAPIDLNCLLYFMERQIANSFSAKKDSIGKSLYLKKALKRKKFIQKQFWNSEVQFFTDYTIYGKKPSAKLTLAGVYPLFFKIATKEQAELVKNRLISDFLQPGGLLTTLTYSGQQWDAPNGWAPLQYMSVIGLLNYGYKEEAREIIKRWLALNEKVYTSTGKMMEKYNVVDTHLLSGGGEYQTQDGFGWTNGVALSFKKLLDTIN